MKLFSRIDETRFRSKVEQYVGRQMQRGLRAGMTAFTMAAEAASLTFTPKVTGNLASSETHQIVGEGWDVLGILRATASYAEFVHNGTGVHGPLGRPIHIWRRPARLHTAVLTFKRARYKSARKMEALRHLVEQGKVDAGALKRTVHKKVTRGSRSGGGEPIEVVSMGMKPRPFFHQGIEAVIDRAEEIFLKAFFSVVEKPQR